MYSSFRTAFTVPSSSSGHGLQLWQGIESLEKIDGLLIFPLKSFLDWVTGCIGVRNFGNVIKINPRRQPWKRKHSKKEIYFC
jgi:hypothetical protein